MGGHAAGEVASSLTIASMAKLDSEPPGGDMLAELAAAVAAANTRLQEMIIANPAVEGMGTTLTALFWSDGHAAVCHIGDSRGYLLREGELYQITHDHTLVQSLVDEGRISADDVSTHPQRSLLLRALDGRSVAEPDLSVHDGQVGDRYLLCSDGLSGVVSDETLRETMAGVEDPETSSSSSRCTAAGRTTSPALWPMSWTRPPRGYPRPGRRCSPARPPASTIRG
jgi:protein phosphatase